MPEANPYATPQQVAVEMANPILAGFKKPGAMAALALVLITVANLGGDAGLILSELLHWDAMWWLANFGKMLTPLALLGSTFFLLWFYRVTYNARLFYGAELSHSPGMAVGGFFIPFANLVLPCGAMLDVFAKTSLALERRPARWLVYSWWLTFLASNILIKFSNRVTDLGLAPFGLRVVALGFLIALVVTLTGGQYRVVTSPELAEKLPITPRPAGIFPWNKDAGPPLPRKPPSSEDW